MFRSRVALLLATAAMLTLWAGRASAVSLVTPDFESALSASEGLSLSTVGGFIVETFPTPPSVGIPAPINNVKVKGNSVFTHTFAQGSTSITATPSTFETAVSLNLTGIGDITGSGVAGGRPITVQAEGQASAGLTFAFGLSGPGSSNPVPVKLTGDMNADPAVNNSDGGSGSTSAFISIVDPLGAGITASTSPTVSFLVLDTTLMIFPGLVYTVSMNVQATMDAGFDRKITLNADVDPILTSEDSDYTIDYTPGLFSSTATPLPGSWIMMMSGLAFIAMLAGRRVRRASSCLLAT